MSGPNSYTKDIDISSALSRRTKNFYGVVIAAQTKQLLADTPAFPVLIFGHYW